MNMTSFSQVNVMDQQNAFAYAAYMMIGAGFRRAVCDSRITEEWLHFQYRQAKPALQDVMADICAAYADKYLPELLPKHIWEERVFVLLDRDYDRVQSLHFEGEDFSMSVRTSYQGKGRAVITCELEQEGEVNAYTTRIYHLGGEMVVFESLSGRDPHGKARQRQAGKSGTMGGRSAALKAREEDAPKGRAREEAHRQEERIRRTLMEAVREGILRSSKTAEVSGTPSGRTSETAPEKVPEPVSDKAPGTALGTDLPSHSRITVRKTA